MFSSAVVFAVIVVSAVAQSPSEKKREVFEKCAKEHSVPQNVLEDAFNVVAVDSLQDYKCFSKCLYDSYDLVNDDGTVNSAKFNDVLKEDFTHPEEQDKLIPVVETCVSKQGSADDQCEYYFSLMSCIYKDLNSVNLNEFTKYRRR